MGGDCFSHLAESGNYEEESEDDRNDLEFAIGAEQ